MSETYSSHVWQFKYIINQILIIRGSPWKIHKLIKCNILDPFIEEYVDLDYLTHRPIYSLSDNTSADMFAREGCLDIIKYLHKLNIPKLFTIYAMEWAAMNGHLEIVKFLHENRKEGCYTWATDWVVTNRHLEIVKYLNKHRNDFPNLLNNSSI